MFIWYHFGPGGVGARATKNGRDVDTDALDDTKAESMELSETRFPVQFERFAMVTDSGGPRKSRGGLGVNRQLRILTPTALTTCSDRHRIPPWGLFEPNGVQWPLL